MEPSSDATTAELQDINPVDTSMDAALELEEMKQGGRDDAPALHRLIELLRTPSRGFSGQDGISMLADMRSFTMLRESLRQVRPKLRATNYDKLPEVINNFLSELERGVSERNAPMVAQAKQFCLALNTSLLAKQMSDIYTRRERADARYISNESLP
jgi:hypothetical protein